MTGEYLRLRNAAPGPVSVAPAELAHLVAQVAAASISGANAKEVLAEHVATGGTAAAIIAERGFRQISDTAAIDGIVDEVLASNPGAVADFAAGKPQAIGFLVGQVMKATRGQANAALVQAALRARLAATSGGD